MLTTLYPVVKHLFPPEMYRIVSSLINYTPEVVLFSSHLIRTIPKVTLLKGRSLALVITNCTPTNISSTLTETGVNVQPSGS